MSQAANLVVNDRAGTPVAHTFAPREVTTGLARFVESNTVPIGEREFSIRWRRANGRFYMRTMLTSPALVTETVNGVSVPTVPRTALIDATFRFDDTSTEQERKDAVGMFANALASSQTMVMGTLVGLEGIW